ncbi:CD226 antigen [Pristis pectinata]|uniref:CD226 antigen n=1 Tax=Pristis pectinata TaxID=685728 RepID=UPI00223D9F3C|nr:CD226 antigen [Pristis pectinata]
MSRLAHYLLLSTGLIQLQKGVNCKEHQNIDSAIKLQDVIKLRCAYPQTTKLTQLSWEKYVNGVKQKIAVYHPQLGENIFPAYYSSVKFLSPIVNGDIILNASAADEGIYQCSINTFPAGTLLKKIEIMNPAKFSRGRAADTHIQLVPGSNVTLFCENPNGSHVQQVMWKQVTEEEMNTIVHQDFTSSSLFIGYDYKERIQCNCSHFPNISLTIQNVTANDMGRYHCQVIMNDGNWTKAFEVGVERDFKKFPIIGGVALGILLSIIVIVVYVWRKEKRKRARRHFKSKSTERNQRRVHQNSYAFTSTSVRTSSRTAEDQKEAIYANLPNSTQMS